jgi:hypothetical protein
MASYRKKIHNRPTLVSIIVIKVERARKTSAITKKKKHQKYKKHRSVKSSIQK